MKNNKGKNTYTTNSHQGSAGTHFCNGQEEQFWAKHVQKAPKSPKSAAPQRRQPQIHLLLRKTISEIPKLQAGLGWEV